MVFVDEAKIYVKAGDGGDGATTSPAGSGGVSAQPNIAGGGGAAVFTVSVTCPLPIIELGLTKHAAGLNKSVRQRAGEINGSGEIAGARDRNRRGPGFSGRRNRRAGRNQQPDHNGQSLIPDRSVPVAPRRQQRESDSSCMSQPATCMDARSKRSGSHRAGRRLSRRAKGKLFSKQQPTAGKESHRSIADNDLREMGGSTRYQQLSRYRR